MNVEDRELVKQVLSAAGDAGQAGFGFLVRYEVAQAITGIFGWGIVIVAALYGLRRAFAWKIFDTYDDARIARGAAIIALLAITFGGLCGFTDSVASLVAPQGAAIARVLHR